MTSTTIYLAKLLKSSSVITRQSARHLFDVAKNTSENNIILDFSSIEYASRSFFDELNYQTSKINQLNKTTSIVNLNKSLNELNNFVLSQSKTKHSPTYASVEKVQVTTL